MMLYAKHVKEPGRAPSSFVLYPYSLPCNNSSDRQSVMTINKWKQTKMFFGVLESACLSVHVCPSVYKILVSVKVFDALPNITLINLYEFVAFSPFSMMSSKGAFFRVFESRDHVVKSLGRLWEKEKMLVTSIFCFSNNYSQKSLSSGLLKV